MVTAVSTPAGRSPVNEWVPLALMGAAALIVWSAPSVAAEVWSTTEWHPGRDLASLVAAYQHLFDPEAIIGSGLQGRRFGYTTIAVAGVWYAVGSIAAGRLLRRRRAVHIRPARTSANVHERQKVDS